MARLVELDAIVDLDDATGGPLGAIAARVPVQRYAEDDRWMVRAPCAATHEDASARIIRAGIRIRGRHGAARVKLFGNQEA
jgi:hypothetical protein